MPSLFVALSEEVFTVPCEIVCRPAITPARRFRVTLCPEVQTDHCMLVAEMLYSGPRVRHAERRGDQSPFEVVVRHLIEMARVGYEGGVEQADFYLDQDATRSLRALEEGSLGPTASTVPAGTSVPRSAGAPSRPEKLGKSTALIGQVTGSRGTWIVLRGGETRAYRYSVFHVVASGQPARSIDREATLAAARSRVARGAGSGAQITWSKKKFAAGGGWRGPAILRWPRGWHYLTPQSDCGRFRIALTFAEGEMAFVTQRLNFESDPIGVLGSSPSCAGAKALAENYMAQIRASFRGQQPVAGA